MLGHYLYYCCSEHYLWLFDGGFLLEAILECIVIVRSFLRLLKLRKLAVGKLDLAGGESLLSVKFTPEYPFNLLQLVCVCLV